MAQIRCDGVRPVCRSCTIAQKPCHYPHDARRQRRSAAPTAQDLEAKIGLLWHHIKTLQHSDHIPDPLQDDLSDVLTTRGGPSRLGQRPDEPIGVSSSPADTSLPSRDAEAPDEVRGVFESARQHQQVHEEGLWNEPLTTTVAASESVNGSQVLQSMVSNSDEHPKTASGPSPSEAQVVGVIDQDGVVSVHGLSSIHHQSACLTNAEQHRDNTSKSPADELSSARLISNATFHRQRENLLYRQPKHQPDLDGVDPELAKHLLDLHWNRQHYAYMLSYRPAVMDSLFSNGPYCNKLLLNAIYYSSSLFSSRSSLLSNANDPQSAGDRFYDRFRALLGYEIVRPSIPTAVGLLLCGATLVSHGRSSAGWILCGTAYRMIVDLGCHMHTDRRMATADSDKNLRSELEREMRKRLYWGAFLTDATQSMYLGRAPAMDLSDARVPLLLLDTYEEFEEWTPYIDPSPEAANTYIPFYSPRPAYAISTFYAMARLFQLSSKISRTFYSIQSVGHSAKTLKTMKQEIESGLLQWKTSLPQHLQFDPSTDMTPPPHQITPQ